MSSSPPSVISPHQSSFHHHHSHSQLSSGNGSPTMASAAGWRPPNASYLPPVGMPMSPGRYQQPPQQQSSGSPSWNRTPAQPQLRHQPQESYTPQQSSLYPAAGQNTTTGMYIGNPQAQIQSSPRHNGMTWQQQAAYPASSSYNNDSANARYTGLQQRGPSSYGGNSTMTSLGNFGLSHQQPWS